MGFFCREQRESNQPGHQWIRGGPRLLLCCCFRASRLSERPWPEKRQWLLRPAVTNSDHIVIKMGETMASKRDGRKRTQFSKTQDFFLLPSPIICTILSSPNVISDEVGSLSTLLSSSRERSGCALEALASGAGAPRRLQGLLSWLFSQSRLSRPCPVFLFSYLREEKGGFRESHAQIAGHEGGEGLPGTCPPPAAGLPAPPRRRPGRTLRMHRDHPVLGKARAGAGTGPLPELTEMLLDSIQDVHAVLAVHQIGRAHV